MALFEERLAVAAREVEAELSRRLAAFAGAPAPPKRLVAALRHATLGGGKRFRPFLVIETARLFGISPATAMPAAAAIECLHCYSLVHDDLPAMDDDDVRRGRPTVHKAFGEATAILAGDALLTMAFEILAEPATHPDAAIRCVLVHGLARSAGWQGMVAGQQIDLQAEERVLDLGEMQAMQARKTGALIAFACDAGAILGRADTKARAALGRYSAVLGSAFQIADDLLDAEGDQEVVGKAVAKDATVGKATYVSLLGIDGARRRLAELETEAVAALVSFGASASVLAEAARFVAARRS